MASEQFSEAFALLANLATKRGVTNIRSLPGLAEIVIDRDWVAYVNGHAETVNHVPPYHAVIEHRGFPVGTVSPRDGVMAAGAEDELIAALRAAGAEV